MGKLLLVIAPFVCLGFFFLGIRANIWWTNFIAKKEARIRVRIASQELEDVPTKILAEELFEREEAWDHVLEHGKKTHEKV